MTKAQNDKLKKLAIRRLMATEHDQEKWSWSAPIG